MQMEFCGINQRLIHIDTGCYCTGFCHAFSQDSRAAADINHGLAAEIGMILNIF